LPLLRGLAAPLPPPAAAGPAESGERPLGRLRLLRTPAFGATLAIVLTPAFVITAVFFHQGALAEWRGWSTASVAGAFVVFAACRTLATLVTGRVVDRVGPLPMLRFHLLPLAGGLLALGFAPASLALWPLFAGLGLTIGAGSVLTVTLWTELFGSRRLGMVRGVHAALMVVATAVSPFLAGLVLNGPEALAWTTASVAVYAALIPWLALPRVHRHYRSVMARAVPVHA
jgi:predicted MFS family arabinose efflux permease